MSWQIGGDSNDDMVDKLKFFGIISSQVVEDSFRKVDRGLFVPASQRQFAYADQPLREEHLHISAPHIYGGALEALELTPGSSLSFLNVGSGTGYLSCIVANILGFHSSNFGIDINRDVLTHAEKCVAAWKSSSPGQYPDIQWIHGNALHIDSEKGEAFLGFDRIYIGAAINEEQLPKLSNLLRPGGILVGPVEDELVKITRVGTRTESRHQSSQSHVEGQVISASDFSKTILSGVRFSRLLVLPATPAVLPSQVWSPSIHQSFPESFQMSCRELLLCSNSPRWQPLPPPTKPKPKENLANMLPKCLWLEILSFAHRDWFENGESEIAYLRRRLKEEQNAAEEAKLALIEANSRCKAAEDERDCYRMLAQRCKKQIKAMLSRSGEDSDTDMDELLLLGRTRQGLALVRDLDSLFQVMVADSDSDVDDISFIIDESNGDETEEGADEWSQSQDLEIDSSQQPSDAPMDTGEDSGIVESVNISEEDNSMIFDVEQSEQAVSRREVRAVSITSEEI